MENKNKIIIALIIIIILLSVLCVLFATNTITFNNKNDNNNNLNQELNENNDNNQNNIINDKVDINLSINNVTVNKDAPNAKISVTGVINLSYDNSKYAGITLSGYCLGADNEKYLINGPGDGRALFHNDENNTLSLTETISQNIEYPNSSLKEWSDINWSNVKIKYCKIDKMTAILNEGNDYPETILNIEKYFK